jgi:PAS domain S-box-containing protein
LGLRPEFACVPVLAKRRTAIATALAVVFLASIAVLVFALAVPISASVLVVALLPIAAAIGWRWRTRLEKFERALRESERRFRDTLDTAPLAAVSLDADGRITYCNDAILGLIGSARDEVLGRNWFDTFIPADQRDALQEQLLRHARSGSVLAQFEGEILTRSGHRRIVAWTNTILRDPDGNPNGTSIVGQDVTDSRRAEAALRKSEALLRLVWDTAVDAMRLTSEDGTVVLANPAYCRLVGRPAAEVVGRSVAEAYAPDRRPDVLRKHAERFTAETGRTYFETEVELHDGRRRRFEAGTAVLNAAGEPPMLLSVLRDVTDRRLAEAALRESEERYRHLFDANPHPMWVYDVDTLRFRAVNEAAVTRYGYSRDEFLRMTALDLLPRRDDGDEAAGQFTDVSPSTIGQHQWKDGTIRDVQITSHAFRDSDRSARLELAMDVTERKKAQVTLAERARLAGLSAEVGAIISRSDNLIGMLRETAEAFVNHLGASFARIWLVNEAEQVLELRASGGKHTHPDGPETRIPVGHTKVGRIAVDGKPYLTNSLRDDSLIGHHEWARAEGLTAFAGYPLIASGRVVGVLALYSARHVSDNAFATFNSLAAGLAQAVERRRAEAALRESEEHFRRLFEDSPIGIYRTTPEGKFLLANPALIRMTGCASFEELVTRSGENDVAIPGYDREKFKRRIDQDGEVRGLDLNWRRGDGTVVHVRENARAVRKPDGALAYYEGTIEDITDLKRVEAALRQQEELLRNVITHIPGGVFWKDRDSVYLGCNELVAQSAGRRPEEMVGMSDFDFGFDKAEAEFYRECDRRVMETGVPILNLEENQTRPEGKVTLLTSKVPLRDESGAVVGVLGIYQDITDRKRLEEQFRQAQKMEAIGRLAGGVAHDFNNLLTVINGFSQVVVDTLEAEHPARPLVDEIGKAGDRAARLTRQLLTFSRQQVVNPRIINLNMVVNGTDRMISRLIGEDIIVSTDLDPDLWPVKIDRGQVEQVLMNLVVNSRDAMPTGGRLMICTGNVAQGDGPPDLPPGHWVALSVSDTGVGMDEATRARVFEPFFTTKGVGKGTGLGLATVYGIVVQNKGHITVEREPGQGATFTIYLPCLAESTPVAESVYTNGPMPNGSETVLLVEDEPAVRALNRRVLESCGYTVLEAGDGLEAVQLVGGLDGPLHILVSDVVMPHLGGRQLAEQLHSIRPGLKVLFVSGYTNDDVVRHGVGSEFDFLQKPFRPMALAHKVREVLDQGR